MSSSRRAASGWPSLARATLAGGTVLLACNGILGVESEYHLEPGADEDGASGGSGGLQGGTHDGAGSGGEPEDGGSAGWHDGPGGEGGEAGAGEPSGAQGGAAGANENGTAGDAQTQPTTGGIPGMTSTGGAAGGAGAPAGGAGAGGEGVGGQGAGGEGGADQGGGVPECAGKAANQTVCRGLDVITCGEEAVTASCDEGTETCVDGECEPCGAGSLNCDDDATDCETELDTVSSCGTTCDDVLQCSGANGAAECAAGSCQIECAAGFEDCGGSNDGCETQLSSTGSCGESCEDAVACDAPSAGACVNGGCRHLWAAWPMPNNPDVDPGTPNPASYTDNGDGTVTDDVTGLMWQQATAAVQYDLNDANAYCTSLSLAGYEDWRLPSRIEALSIVDYGREDPAIDTDFFPDTESRSYWTSTRASWDSMQAWGIYMADGGSDGDPATVDHYVRCVR